MFDDPFEVGCGMGIGKERGHIAIHERSARIIGDQIPEIGREDRVFEIAFKDFLAWFAGP